MRPDRTLIVSGELEVDQADAGGGNVPLGDVAAMVADALNEVVAAYYRGEFHEAVANADRA